MPRNSVPNSLGIPLQISSPTPGGQRFHPNWPDVDKIESFSLLTLLNYQSKKRRKQMESGCGTGITNHQKSVWNNFQYLKYELTSKSGGGHSSPPPHPNSAVFHSILALFDTPWGPQKISLIALSQPLLQGFFPVLIYFQLTTHIWPNLF